LITVSGQVVSSSGVPVPGVSVHWSNDAGGQRTSGSLANGSFTLTDVTSGPATLVLQAGGNQGDVTAQAQVSFDSDVSGVTLSLPSLISVPVLVQGAGGGPVSGASVYATVPTPSGFGLHCPAGSYTMLAGQLSASCAQDGDYVGAANTDSAGHTSVLFVDDPTVTGSAYATAQDQTNTARVAQSALFDFRNTPLVTVTLPDRPSAPQAPSAAPDGSTATVSWQPPATDGGSALTGYAVTATPSTSAATGSVTMRIASMATMAATTAPATITTNVAAGQRTVRLSGLQSGTTYNISVLAKNAIGKSPGATASVTMLPVVQETSSLVQFDAWRYVKDSVASGGAYRQDRTAGQSASFSFTGTSVSWITEKGSTFGIANVSIDGVNKGAVDLYAATKSRVAQTYSGLSSGAHTIVVAVAGTKNAHATNNFVAVDAFKVGTAVTQESAPTITFDSWANIAAAAADGGAYRRTAVANSVARTTFSGTGVDWVTVTGPTYGQAQVFIDGVDQGRMDLYSPTQQLAVVKSYGGLGAGSHTLIIVVLGTHSGSAGGNNVAVDGFVVH
jgi:hypothetical protein